MDSPIPSGGQQASSAKQWKKPKPKSKVSEDDSGLTPEEVHEYRYSGIRMETACIDDDIPTESFVRKDPSKVALAKHRKVSALAEEALQKYKILLQHDIMENFHSSHVKYDDLGTQPFIVMHLMRTFLSTPVDHAPIEVTAVRLRLSTGVEKDILHTFPSPLPIPFGKQAEYTAGEKEFHEIDAKTFKLFDNDYIDVFYKLLLVLTRRSPGGIPKFPKIPLIICVANSVSHSMMMFEYLHQRALADQQEGIKTSAPSGFIVPEKLQMAFCDILNFERAFRVIIMEMGFNMNVYKNITVDGTLLNLCPYHQTTNKLNCTTYCVSEVVERLLLFSHFFTQAIPSRFVQPYDLAKVAEIRSSSAAPSNPEVKGEQEVETNSSSTNVDTASVSLSSIRYKMAGKKIDKLDGDNISVRGSIGSYEKANSFTPDLSKSSADTESFRADSISVSGDSDRAPSKALENLAVKLKALRRFP